MTSVEAILNSYFALVVNLVEYKVTYLSTTILYYSRE